MRRKNEEEEEEEEEEKEEGEEEKGTLDTKNTFTGNISSKKKKGMLGK
jgi:hypothetical protein